MTCDGSCEEHIGTVTRVHVWYGAYDWGLFNYCEAAKQEDRNRGLTVDEAEKGA